MGPLGGAGEQVHRLRWRREKDQRWVYGLGAAVLAVLLPVAAGYPDPRVRLTEARGEMLVAIVATAAGAAAILAIAALIRRSPRAAWFGAAIGGLMFGHPVLDDSFGTMPRLAATVRLSVVAAVVLIRVVAIKELRLPGRLIRDLAGALAVVAVVLEAAAVSPDVWQADAASFAIAGAVLAIGSIDFVRGQRRAQGDVAAFGMTALSFGFGGLLLLSSGGQELTVGAACVSIVTAVCAVAASVIAVFEALAYREARLETFRLSEALAVTQLDAQSKHLAQLAHDQRGALLAIEAAARRLQEQPSFDLAAAVAAEAERLQRNLSDELAEKRFFDVRAAVEPMFLCMQSLGTDISLTAQASPLAWGAPDEVTEIVRTLVDNAIAHGAGEVRIEVFPLGSMVLVVVSDEGEGVPLALQESIFDRGVSTDPRNHPGLGLWAARRSAEKMGGWLRASTARRSAFELGLRTDARSAGDEATNSSDEMPTRRPLREAGDG